MRLIDADALRDSFLRRATSAEEDQMPMTAADLRLVARDIDHAPTVGGWVSVEDRLPEETESMFARFHGTEKWDNAMWLKESKQVIVAIEFTDGGKRVTLGRLHDGEWHTTVSVILPHTVTHWMPLPDPPDPPEEGRPEG